MPDTQYCPIPPEDQAHMDRQRDWVRGHYNPESQSKYDTTAGKVRILGAILSNKWIEPHETWKLQSLGVTLGDILAADHELEWTMVSDEDGTEPALRQAGTSLVLFPVTMISKRIENGEDVEIHQLLRQIKSGIDEARQQMTADKQRPN